MFKAIFSAFISGLWSAILSRFGLSVDRKLGRAETVAQTQAQIIKEVSDANTMDRTNSTLSDDELRSATKEWQRAD